jgi:NodT family efflux transporter outer membrane factor (OMF) lipoprotein
VKRPAGAFSPLLAVAVAILLCQGCRSPPQPAPQMTVPAAWIAPQTDATAPLTEEWFRGFGSEELSGLVKAAREHSLDLQSADARVRQADARARAAGGAILPKVDFNANATSYAGSSANGNAHETDYAALISASYEVDFWGKNRAALSSASALREVSAADRAVVALSVVTGVANTYFQTLSLRERLALAKLTLENSRQLLAMVVARHEVGMANPTEVAQQRAVVASAEIRIRELEQQEAEALAALAILTGQTPGSLTITAQRLSDFAEPQISAGLPAQLLERRPDVFAAEENLRAAHADLRRARAAFFPSITLTGSGGVQNPGVQAAVVTLAGAGPTVTLGAAVAQSIFDGGRLRAARDEADAKEQEMLAQYRAAILSALWDVETALSAVAHLDQQEASQTESLAQGELALAGAQARYREGVGDFQTVLNAQQSLYAAREVMSQYRLARFQAVVGLCKALGGGWAQDQRH